MPQIAYIALGSNLGKREDNLRRALAALAAREGIAVRRVSPFLETAPVGGPPQGPFLNAAAELETTLEPPELLAVLHQVERELGRERTVRWGPRTIDLDLLLYGERVIDEQGLRLPHPRMHERRFVLDPLSQIAPDARHPILDRTVRELLAELERDAGGLDNRRGNG